MTRSISHLHSFFSMLAAFATFAGIVCVVIVIGPAVESRFWPVVVNAQFVVAHRDRGRMALDWVALRQRETCSFISAIALVQRNDEWHPAVISRSGDDTDAPLPGITRPAGYQRFSRIDVIPDGTSLRMTLRHNCHPLWVTVTTLPAVNL